jgi:hypothetical protein
MTISDNQFTQKNLGASGNNPTDSSVEHAVGTPVEKALLRGTTVWNGVNLSDAPFGVADFYGGDPFGMGVFGGIAHFKRRTKYSITR